MNIRDALIQQSPSLALQRAAADEIAKRDALLIEVRSCFTRDDDLPDNLLSRIDEVLK